MTYAPVSSNIFIYNVTQTHRNFTENSVSLGQKLFRSRLTVIIMDQCLERRVNAMESRLCDVTLQAFWKRAAINRTDPAGVLIICNRVVIVASYSICVI
jgi:hypothetical protein